MIIKRKYKEKVFKDNESYLEFINKMKDIVNIISVKVLRHCVKVKYESK